MIKINMDAKALSLAEEQIQEYCEQFRDDNLSGVKTVYLIGPRNFPSVALEGVREPIIYIDGGVAHRKDQRGLAVGDGDSLNASSSGGIVKTFERVPELDITLPVAKDFSDFAFVLRSLPVSIHRVSTFGFMGGRVDHQVINFGEAHHFLQLRENTILSFDFEAWGFSAGTWRPRIQGIFSLLNFESCDVRMEGLCDFQIKEFRRMRPVTSVGLSNVGHGQIEIESSGPFFLLTERRLHMDE